MSLIVLTGPVRSGKSAAAEALAARRVETGHAARVVVAVAGWDGDEEMVRRIAAHRASRPADWRTLVAGPDPAWVAEAGDGLLLLDCLSSLVGAVVWEEAGDALVITEAMEDTTEARAHAIVSALRDRRGDTIVVTNEAGWGVVPDSAAGRLFRDVLGRANRAIVEAADSAYLVVAGRCIDLRACPSAPGWPSNDTKES